jgi:hypothetical protein
MITKHADALTLRDRLSRLTFVEAAKLLGAKGASLIRQGGKIEIDPGAVSLDERRLQVVLPDARVSIALTKTARARLGLECTSCSGPCAHLGAVVSMILEDKSLLGLAAPPDESVPIELLTESQLIERMLAERLARARDEKMSLKALSPDVLWSDYLVTNAASGKTYRVALRGWERGEAYCTCPDFRKNTLGTCKHILFALGAARRFPAAVRKQPYRRTGISLHLHYGKEVELRLLLPQDLPRGVATWWRRSGTLPLRTRATCWSVSARSKPPGWPVNVYPDAEEYMNQRLFLDRIRADMDAIRKDPAAHPLRRNC